MPMSHAAQRLSALRLKMATLATCLAETVAASCGDEKARTLLSAAADGQEEVVLDVLREAALPLATSSHWQVFIQLKKLVEGLIDVQTARSARMIDASLAYAERTAFA